MTAVLEDYPGSFLVVEASPIAAIPGKNQDIPEYLNLYRYVDSKLCAPFNFELIRLPWDARFYKSFIDNFQSKLHPDYLPIYTFGNHDNPRLASRIGEEAIRVAAMLLLTLPGLPFIYYGEEIGMKDVQIPRGEQKDPSRFGGNGRDAARTPLQWNKSNNAGFSSQTPWLPVDKDYEKYNIETQLAKPDSLLNLYRALTMLRRQSDALRHGNYLSLEINHSSVYGFIRQTKAEKIAIILNFSSKKHSVESKGSKGKIIFSTYLDKENLLYKDLTELRPNEGIVINLS
jgi:alpha-glucosidase